jgi:UDP-N-acetylglucosamine 2-epimerase (hydrolysing)
MSKHVIFVTGTRADFGKLEPLAISLRDAGFRVGFFVTGMHLMERYGLTKVEVSRVENVEVREFPNQAYGDPQDLILANTVIGFSSFCKEMNPDLVVVHGDRVEALACSLVCATNYIRCAHVEGGEVSGTIDEIFRHCCTKLAASHFVSSDIAKTRIMNMGESDDVIFPIGSPELDTHSSPSGVNISDVKSHYDIPFDDFGIAMFHPVTSEQSTIGEQAKNLFNTLAASNKNFVVILPNNDPGSDDIFAALSDLPADRFRQIPSMRFSYFSELLRNASALIGNSSAGVREAPFLGLPSLDVGTRQNKRASAKSVSGCAANETDAITSFLTTEWGKSYSRDQGFGAGSAADRFLDVLSKDIFWDRPLQKEFKD